MTQRIEPTPRSRVRRLPRRGVYDRGVVNAILDEALICHVGLASPEGPVVLPMIHGRVGTRLFLHGSAANHMLRALKGGAPACVEATIVDGLVLARSAFHHSMNYRSVVVFGEAQEVSEPKERLRALAAISEHVLPGRWAQARKPNAVELKQTLVLKLDLSECSAKARTGPPTDEEEDYALDIWAGVIPVLAAFGQVEADPRLRAGIRAPGYLPAEGSALSRRLKQ